MEKKLLLISGKWRLQKLTVICILTPDGKANTDKSQNGHLSGGVPGTVAGLFASLQYAKLPFEKLIQPAIESC